MRAGDARIFEWGQLDGARLIPCGIRSATDGPDYFRDLVFACSDSIRFRIASAAPIAQVPHQDW